MQLQLRTEERGRNVQLELNNGLASLRAEVTDVRYELGRLSRWQHYIMVVLCSTFVSVFAVSWYFHTFF